MLTANLRKPNTQITESPDPYGASLESYWRTGRGACHFTRDDGWKSVDEPSWYFSSYPEFPKYEKRALRFASGRVLDIGCGPGRHALHLQRKGLEVIGIDTSERIAAIARERGVRDVRIASACEGLPFNEGEFNTVILFGNNLGICGSRPAVAEMLGEIHRISRKHARLLVTTRAPNLTNPAHLNYWRKKQREEDFGIVHLRLEFAGESKEMDLLWLAPQELLILARKTSWELVHVYTDVDTEEGYAAVLTRLG